MKYDAYGKTGQPFPFSCHVRDATGAILTPVKACDTETGQCERYILDVEGHFIVGENGLVLTETRTYPSPLTVVAGKPDEAWPYNLAPFAAVHPCVHGKPLAAPPRD